MKKFVVLNRNNDYRRIYARGRSFTGSVLVTYVMKNRRGVPRMGITTSKQVGKAVKRNRARRLIREAYRMYAPEIRGGYDLIFVARAKTPYVKCGQVAAQMKKHLEQAGVLK